MYMSRKLVWKLKCCRI